MDDVESATGYIYIIIKYFSLQIKKKIYFNISHLQIWVFVENGIDFIDYLLANSMLIEVHVAQPLFTKSGNEPKFKWN